MLVNLTYDLFYSLQIVAEIVKAFSVFLRYAPLKLMAIRTVIGAFILTRIFIKRLKTKT